MELSKSSSDGTETSLYMCLRCRQVGHVFNDCPNEWFTEGFIMCEKRRDMDFGCFDEIKDQPLCSRCQELDLLNFLSQDIPWDSMLGLQDDIVRESGILRSLGQVGSVIFKQNCSLCRCIFAMTQEPDSVEQEVMLMPSWTMCRLEGGISIDTPEKQTYARALLVVLDPTLTSQPLGNAASRGDALCLLEEDRTDPETTLGGRIIDPKSINLETVETWMSTCSKLHPVTCSPSWTEILRGIHLIDVKSRQLVRHPNEQCDYLALSYVWGGVNQGSYKLGDTLNKVPQTIEDGIAFTIKLGRRYLWVDSICIDQGNEAEKLSQIRMMSSIYEGAAATIISMSSESANTGLPRLQPEIPMFSQMKCCVGGRRLVGLMPTLSQLIWGSAWGDRAWTLQEALLSRRCIYMSDQQLYFECNAMQCSESLDESRSWVHHISRDAEFVKNGHSEKVVGAGVLRSPFVGTTHTNNRLAQYTVLANLYSYRDMSFPADAINGFSGIIQYLTRLEYKEGFFYGLPIEDMNWAMGFGFQSAIDRRENFPSWSWAGWKARLVDLTPSDIMKPHYFQVSLRIQKFSSGQLVTLLNLPKQVDLERYDALEILPPAHPFKHLVDSECTDLDFDLTTFSTKDIASHLFIEGLIFSFKPDYSRPRQKVRQYGEVEFFDMAIGGVPVLLRLHSVDSIIDDPKFQDNLRCLLLARDRNDWGDYYYLLVLDGNGVVAGRRTVLRFQTRKNDDGIWEPLDVKKRRIVLK